jgi:hypothetical protein
MVYNVVITLLTDDSATIIIKVAKLGFKVCLWDSNNPYIKISNGPGGVLIIQLEPKSNTKVVDSKEVLTKIQDILLGNLIPFFSISVWEVGPASAAVVQGNLKPVKKEIPVKKEKNITKPSYLKIVK